jgi:hypothetical protein
MRFLPVILAVLAVIFILADGYIGPIYTMSNWCECHRSYVWLEFNESESLRGVALFLRVEEPGDPQHHHQFTDAKYDGQYPVLFYIGVGFGISSVVAGLAVWFYGRKRALPDL